MRRDVARTRAARTLGADAVAETEARVGEAARHTPFWEVDVVPLTGGTFTETGTPGALAIVGAGGYVLTGEVLARRPVGAADRAQAVLVAVMSAARNVGVLPERLHVPDEALADALRPELERRGTGVKAGPLPELDEATAGLRHELHRRWLVWHDEVVRGGITDTRDVRDILLGRQRQWENTPHPRHGGRTSRQVLIDMSDQMDDALSRLVSAT